MIAKSWSELVTRFVFVAGVFASCAVMLSGCTTMVSTRAELQNIGDNEGVVFGSVFITVETGKENESYWSIITSQSASSMPYQVMITDKKMWKTSYFIYGMPEKEEIFIKKLPAGDYQINEIRMQKFGYDALVWKIKVNFRIAPKQTTYIGRFTAQIPDRIRVGSRVRMSVVDAQQATIEQLRNEYEGSFSEVVQALMAIQR